MKNYEIISTTADTGIKCRGKDYQELLKNALAGLNGLLFEKTAWPHPPEEPVKIPLKLAGDSYENLTVKLLAEVLYLWEMNRQIAYEIEIIKISPTFLSGTLNTCFTEIKPAVEIKGVTYHNLQIQDENNHKSLKIIFDI